MCVSDENKRNTLGNGLSWVHRTRVPNFRVLPPTNGVDIGCLPNLVGVCLNQPAQYPYCSTPSKLCAVLLLAVQGTVCGKLWMHELPR